MVFSRILRLNSFFTSTYKHNFTRPTLSLHAIDFQPSCSFSYSTSAPLPHTDSPPPDPTTTLSSRMSFVFDQIDTIHRQRNADVDEKDEALQRIRAWRHSKQQKREEVGGTRQVENEVETKMEVEEEKGVQSVIKKEVEMVHPWPEWIEFMERLLQQNYLDHRRIDEDRMVENVPGINLNGLSKVGDDDFDENVELEFWRDWAAVCTACKNFAHDRFDIFKSLSRKDIQVLVGYGCPSLDGKVVYSAKLLRKHSHVNEGDVCSACTLRSSCKKGFLLVPKEDEARTLDIMRILLTFGFDSINGSVKNRPLMKMKPIKAVVRKLLYEIVKLSAVPIDPNLPRPVIKKSIPKVKQAPPPPKKRVGRDDVEMKKGDWVCAKCDFMNFAKNAVCLQCDAKRPKRQLLPGEWECPECNFLNYRRNMACFHCECKRPQDEYTDNQVHEKKHEPRNGPTGSVRMPNVSDAWNLDFDENESDGADVAAFEFADPPRRTKGDSEKYSHEEMYGEYDEHDDHGKGLRTHKKEEYSSNSDERNINSRASRTGFDDFDDEEDDVDSYEIDMTDNNKDHVISRKNFSELENASDSEEFDDFDNYNHSRNDDVSLPKSKVFDYVPKIKTHRNKDVSYGSEDDDDDIGYHSDSDNRYGKHSATSMRRGKGFQEQTVRQNQRFDRISRNSFEKNDAWDSRRGQRNDRGAVHSGFSSNKGHNRSDRVNKSDRSGQDLDFEHNHHQNDRGRRVNQFGGRSDRANNDRSGRAMDFGHNHHQNDRGRRVNQFGGRNDRGKNDRSGRVMDFGHNHHQNDQGRRINQFGGRKSNDRRDDSRASSRSFGRDRIESSRNRSNENGNTSRSEERPRRRIIER